MFALLAFSELSNYNSCTSLERLLYFNFAQRLDLMFFVFITIKTNFNEECPARFHTCLGPMTLLFSISPFRMGVPIACYCVLESDNLSDFTSL